MQANDIQSFLAVPGAHTEIKGRCFRMKYGRAFVEIDLDCTPEELYNAKQYLGVVIERNRRPSRARVSPLPVVQDLHSDSPLLSKATEFYIDNLITRKRGKSTIKSRRNSLRILLAVAGDIPISMIDYKVIAEFMKQLRWWPPNAMARKDLKHLSPKEILEVGIREARPEVYAEWTKKAHIGALNAFFATYLKVGQVPRNPMEIFKEEDSSRKPAKTRFPLKPQELAQIFDPVAFKEWAAKYPHRWWIPQIALYTGARVDEIAQLRAADIRMDNGSMCFTFKVLEGEEEGRAEGMRDKTFKNEISQRVVPIAIPLIEVGFLDYVKEVRAAGLLRLFPQLKAGINKETGELNGSGYSVAHIQQFGDYLREHTDLQKGVGTHAFRHTLATALRNTTVSPAIVASITGHGEDTERGRFKNLDNYTEEEAPETLRPKQADALSLFNPGVSLPGYTPGQFAHCLGPDAKLNP